MTTAPEIVDLIQQFISGRDTSVEAANRIEVALDDCFPEDEYVQETVAVLAMYRPGGGEFLHDFEAVKPRLIRLLTYLSRTFR